MRPVIDYQRFAVLYVDDEEMALKYFQRALNRELRVLTATSVADAITLLDRHGEEIGVLVTDQRMPGQTGVDLLRTVRQEYPTIVRLLTTAYSDLNDAIEAVNTGEIYRYITKPWDLGALRADVRQAMELFLLRYERDQLMSEKFSIRRRQVAVDRARDWVVMAGTVSQLRYPLVAVRAFLERMPHGAATVAETGALDLWGLQDQETRRSLRIAQEVQVLTSSGTPSSFGKAVLLTDLLAAAGVPVALTAGLPAAALPALGVDWPRAVTLLMLLARRIKPVALEARPVTQPPGIALTLRGPSDGEITTDERCEAEWGAVFLLCAHHGGELVLADSAEAGKEARLRLPLDPTAIRLADPPEDWLEQVYSRYES
jgi:two-component system probable response regulator PhcQ